MTESERLQRAIRTPIVQYEKPVEQPFLPPPEPLFTPKQASYLNEVIPEPWPLPPPRIPPKPTIVEEQYAPTERMVLITSTTQTFYDIKTAEPKQILLIAEDQDHLIEFNRSIDENSTKIFAKGSLAMTGKGVNRIYAKCVSGSGKIYIRVWGP